MCLSRKNIRILRASPLRGFTARCGCPAPLRTRPATAVEPTTLVPVSRWFRPPAQSQAVPAVSPLPAAQRECRARSVAGPADDLQPDQRRRPLPVVVPDVDAEANHGPAIAPPDGASQQADSAGRSPTRLVLRTGREAFTPLQLPGGWPLSRHPGRLPARTPRPPAPGVAAHRPRGSAAPPSSGEVATASSSLHSRCRCAQEVPPSGVSALHPLVSPVGVSPGSPGGLGQVVWG